MEYCACGSMKDVYALKRRALNEDQTREVIAFAVLGLHHIHNLRCLHRVTRSHLLVLFSAGYQSSQSSSLVRRCRQVG